MGTTLTAPSEDTRTTPLQVAAANLLADMSDEQFDLALKRVAVVAKRQVAIMDSVLERGVHYGNPLSKDGKPVFKNDILFIAGAEHLVDLFRCQWGVDEQADTEEVSEGYVRVTIRRVLYDGRGRFMARGEGTCTSHEKRFRSVYGAGFIWKDAREVLHDIRAHATKRCKVTTTLDAFGLRGYIGQEEGEDDDKARRDERVINKWTDAERKLCYEHATAKGITREQFGELVQQTLGRGTVGTGKDVERVLAAIKTWEAPKA